MTGRPGPIESVEPLRGGPDPGHPADGAAERREDSLEPGTLGLATAYGSVAAWGGSIEVDSSPGSGTTFRFLLQVAPPA